MKPDRGFTFLEVMIALLIATLLVTVSSKALLTILQAERQTAWSEEAGCLLGSVNARAYLADRATDTNLQVLPDWQLTNQSVTVKAEQPEDAPPVNWHVWSCAPEARPSFQVRFAYRGSNTLEQLPPTNRAAAADLAP